MEIKVALSSMRFDRKPEGGAIYKELTGSFINSQNEPMDFMNMVMIGHPYTVWLKDNWRCDENFVCGQHISLDFDEANVTPASFENDPFVLKYASFAYPTLSSSPAEPRTRLVFVLDQPIMQAENMRRAYRAMMYLYGNADPKCKDASRFFFGAGGGDGAWYGNVLPLKKVVSLIGKFEDDMALLEARKPPTREQHTEGYESGKALIRYWEDRVTNAQKGERNDTLNKAAYSLGQLVGMGKMALSHAEDSLMYCGRVSGLTEEEVKRTIKSGLEARRN